MNDPSSYKDCYWAFCRTPRRVFMRKHIHPLHVFWTTTFGLALSFAIFGTWDPRSMLIVAVLIGVSEILVIMRWRLSMTCSHCGFDPLVYMKDPKMMVERVKRRLEERQKDSLSIFRTQLPILEEMRRYPERFARPSEVSPSPVAGASENSESAESPSSSAEA